MNSKQIDSAGFIARVGKIWAVVECPNCETTFSIKKKDWRFSGEHSVYCPQCGYNHKLYRQ